MSALGEALRALSDNRELAFRQSKATRNGVVIPFHKFTAGSLPAVSPTSPEGRVPGQFAALAQMAEQPLRKRSVASSSLAGGTSSYGANAQVDALTVRANPPSDPKACRAAERGATTQQPTPEFDTGRSTLSNSSGMAGGDFEQ